jgi:rhodanese-related sulfurtransferase
VAQYCGAQLNQVLSRQPVSPAQIFRMDNAIKHFTDKLEHETDSWDLKSALDLGERIIVIDARSLQSFQEEHLPNAINFPHRTMNEESTRHLDRSALYIVYCDGIGCNASTKGSLALARLGFRVKELIGGLDWWKRDGYKTESSTSPR